MEAAAEDGEVHQFANHLQISTFVGVALLQYVHITRPYLVTQVL